MGEKRKRQINFVVECEDGEVRVDRREHQGLKWCDAGEVDEVGITEEVREVLKKAFQTHTNENGQPRVRRFDASGFLNTPGILCMYPLDLVNANPPTSFKMLLIPIIKYNTPIIPYQFLQTPLPPCIPTLKHFNRSPLHPIPRCHIASPTPVGYTVLESILPRGGAFILTTM